MLIVLARGVTIAPHSGRTARPHARLSPVVDSQVMSQTEQLTASGGPDDTPPPAPGGPIQGARGSGRPFDPADPADPGDAGEWPRARW